MGLMQALSLLGTGAEGYVQGGYDAATQKRLADAAAFEQTQRQRILAQQSAVDAAGNPITATPDTATSSDGTVGPPMQPDASGDNIDAGQPGTAPPVAAPPTSSVQGFGGGLNPMQTQAALAAANTPQAQAARQAAALSRTDPVAAAKLTEATTTAQAQQLDFANKKWNNDVEAARSDGWAGLEKFTKDSAATPGSQGAKFVPSADGKTMVLNISGPDGTLHPQTNPDGTPKTYPNNSDGMDQAAFDLERVPPEAKLAHAQAVATAASEAEERTQRAAYWKSMAEAANKKGDAALENADNKGAKTTVEKMNPDDAAEYKDLAGKSEKLDAALTKGRLDAAGLGQTFDVADPTLKPLFVQKAAYDARMQALLAKYRANQTGADPAGLRGGGTGTTTTTRAQTPEEQVAADMAKTGVKDATSTLRQPDNSVVTRVFGKGATPMQAKTAPPAAPAPAAGGFTPDPAMEAQVLKEQTEMGATTRTAYSAPVQAYLAQKAAAKDAADEAASQAYRQRELQRALAASKVS